MYGNFGRVLEVELTNASSSIIELDDDYMQCWLGGAALGTRLLYDATEQGVSHPVWDSPLILSAGPFQSTSFPGSGKWLAISRSPLTRTFCASAAGASFGPNLKKTGFDAVVLKGKSEHPVVVSIIDGNVRFHDAVGLWGMDALQTHETLLKKFAYSKFSTLTIGPAGEKCVAMACLVADGHSFAGRGGLGAIMGYKNLKAILVGGSAVPNISNPKLLRTLTKTAASWLHRKTEDGYGKHGTALDLQFCESVGDMPVKYWEGDTWQEGARLIGAPRYTEYLSAKRNPCFACPIGCHRLVRIPGASDPQHWVPGPEYESLAMLGAVCLIDDLDAISIANDLCNRLGLDTISAGAAVGFAMQCYERGLLSKSDIGNIDLVWGNSEALLEIIKQIGTRSGLGALFSDGIRTVAQSIGGGAVDLPVEVKGMDFPAHDPRCHFSLALNYATSTQGASHLRGFPHVGEIGMLIPEMGYTEQTERFSMEGKPALAVLFQDYALVLDSLVDCCFMQISGLSLSHTLEALNAITGWQYDAQSLVEIGKRAFTLQRLINLGDGITKDDDRLPQAMFKAADKGPREGQVPRDLTGYLQEYYAIRGWSKTGIPTRETLKSLKLLPLLRQRVVEFDTNEEATS